LLFGFIRTLITTNGCIYFITGYLSRMIFSNILLTSHINLMPDEISQFLSINDHEYDISNDLLSVIIAIASVFLFIILALLKQRARLERHTKIETLFLLKENTPVKNYYLFVFKNQDEIFPPRLKSLLTDELELNCFEDFQSVLTDESYAKLKCKFDNELKKGSFLEVEDYDEISQEKEKFLISTSRGDHFFECEAELVNEYSKDAGVIIWFNEISQEMAKYATLEDQNHELNSKLNLRETIINNLPFPIWYRDSKDNIIYNNISYEMFSNHTPTQKAESAINKNAINLAHESREEGSECSAEVHLISRGERKLYKLSECALKDDSCVGYALNYEDKEKINAELKMHLAAQSDLLESSASAIAIYGADTKLKYFNQAFMKLWKLEEGWLVTNPTYGEMLETLRGKRLLPEQANFKSFKEQQIGLFTNLIKTHDEFFYLPDGRALRVIVIPHALGGLLFLYEDMTDRLTLERSYNALAAVQRTTIENLQEGVAVFGLDGRLKLCNPSYNRIWELTKEFVSSSPHVRDIINKIKDSLVIKEGNADDFANTMLSDIETRKIVHRQIERKKGAIIDRTCTPLPDGAILITYMDVTDKMSVEKNLRESNEMLQQNDRAKTELMANIASELNTPLSQMFDSTNWLYLNANSSSEARQQHIFSILSKTNSIKMLMQNITDLSSLESGSIILDISEVQFKTINQCIHEVIATLKEIKDIIFKSKLIKTGKLVGDERRIQQIITNLILFIFEFAEQNDEILITTLITENNHLELKLELINSNVNLEFLNLSSFDNFGNEARHLKPSLGINLKIARNFTNLHGGEIDFSYDKKFGTTLICRLPIENTELLTLLGKIHVRDLDHAERD
jgi:PAS domain-containing protein